MEDRPDISSLTSGGQNVSDGDGAPHWLGVHFTCAGRYVRVGRRADGTGYLARCPRCGKTLRFRVGPGGTDRRFFEVSCAG